jgi:hypothetical protein
MSFATPLVEHLVRSAFDLLGFDIKQLRPRTSGCRIACWIIGGGKRWRR